MSREPLIYQREDEHARYLKHLQAVYNQWLDGFKVMGYWTRHSVGFLEWCGNQNGRKSPWKQAVDFS